MLDDTSWEIEVLQNKLWMEKSPQERTSAVSSMFAAAREVIISSLPNNLPEKDLKKHIFFRTYGEHLPDDFFDKGRR